MQYQTKNKIASSKFEQLLKQSSSQAQEFYKFLIKQECSASNMDKIVWHLKSTYQSFKNIKYWTNFNSINSYCTFIGCGRTGHSLIGSLIDAHPDMVIADEIFAATLIDNGISKRKIYSAIIEESRIHAKRGRKVAGYSYKVKDQWQGKLRSLKVIGEKSADPTTAILQQKPYLLDLLNSKFNTQVKFIHVLRNPYDVIKTFTTREKVTLKSAIELYYLVCQAVAEVKSKINSHDIFEFKHENFLENPKQYLKYICQFLEVEATTDYLESCINIVYKSPRQRRYEIEWDSESINLVKKIIDEYSFLQGYCFEV